MSTLINVIAPVFFLMAFGYVVRWRKLLDDDGIDVIMRFAQNFAIPVLLARSIGRLDLGAEFDPALLIAFYIGAFASFGLGALGARKIFKRNGPDSVAIGFVCLFSNSLLLGIPITERAFGTDALAGNFIIISIHAPLLYTFGITVMEFTKARGQDISLGGVMWRALSGVLHTPLVIGIAFGFLINALTQAGLVLPEGIWGGIDMMATAAIPTALFGLGGVLYRYKPEGDMGAIAMCCLLSLMVHPAITFGIAKLVDLDVAGTRSAVITAAMAPGVNTYIFANIYAAGRRVAASAVLIGTAASVLSVTFWLMVV